MNDIRWYLANYAMRFTFWLMPESRAKSEYYDAVKAISIKTHGVVIKARSS